MPRESHQSDKGASQTACNVNIWCSPTSYGISRGWVGGIYTNIWKTTLQSEQQNDDSQYNRASELAAIIRMVTHKNTSFPIPYGRWKPYQEFHGNPNYIITQSLMPTKAILKRNKVCLRIAFVDSKLCVTLKLTLKFWL